MNKFLLMHRIGRWLPVGQVRHFRITRAIFARQQRAERKAIAPNDREKLQSFHSDWQYAYVMLDDEERDYHSRKLLARANDLRLMTPKVFEGKELTGDYEESSITGRINLTRQGEATVRDAIRAEEKHRSESRARLIPYISAMAGLIGTMTGLAAVIDKWGR